MQENDVFVTIIRDTGEGGRGRLHRGGHSEGPRSRPDVKGKNDNFMAVEDMEEADLVTPQKPINVWEWTGYTGKWRKQDFKRIPEVEVKSFVDA